MYHYKIRDALLAFRKCASPHFNCKRTSQLRLAGLAMAAIVVYASGVADQIALALKDQ